MIYFQVPLPRIFSNYFHPTFTVKCFNLLYNTETFFKRKKYKNTFNDKHLFIYYFFCENTDEFVENFNEIKT